MKEWTRKYRWSTPVYNRVGPGDEGTWNALRFPVGVSHPQDTTRDPHVSTYTTLAPGTSLQRNSLSTPTSPRPPSYPSSDLWMDQTDDPPVTLAPLPVRSHDLTLSGARGTTPLTQDPPCFDTACGPMDSLGPRTRQRRVDTDARCAGYR